MKLNSLSEKEIVTLIKAMKSFIDGNFFSVQEIQRVTGLPSLKCQEILDQFSILRAIEV